MGLKDEGYGEGISGEVAWNYFIFTDRGGKWYE